MMDGEKLFFAVDGIDAELIDEASGYRFGKRTTLPRALAAAAAALVLCGALFAALKQVGLMDAQRREHLPENTAAPSETGGRSPLPAMPDPVMPGTNALMPWQIPREWIDNNGSLKVRLYENGLVVAEKIVTSNTQLAVIERALESDWLINAVELSQGELEGYDRIDLESGGSVMSIFSGTNRIRCRIGSCEKWMQAEDYSGSEFGEDRIFAELVRGGLFEKH